MMRSFRSQVALLSGVTAMAVIALISLITTRMLSNHVARDQGQALQVLAQSTATMLGEGLHERLREIELLADSISIGSGDASQSAQVRRALDRAQQTRLQYSWIGLTTPQGDVRIAAKDMLVGKNVSARPWFQAALKGPHVGDVHEAKLLAKMLPRTETGEPIRFVDFAAPVMSRDGKLIGVLGAHADWRWARGVIRTLRSDEARNQGVLVFILDRDGEVIHRPDGPEGQIEPLKSVGLPPSHQIVAWSDHKRYLTATARLNHPDTRTQMGWTIVVRQPEDQALSAAAEVREALLELGLAAAVVAVLGAWLAAGRVSKPLRRLTRAASRIHAGDLDARLPPLAGSQELRTLSESLSGMTQTLQQHRHALEQANASLEQKVQARTNELERANAELALMARKDGLTGLFNRRAADDRLGEEAARHQRYGQTLSLLVLDIDHFKRINDTFGHAAGDEALRQVARCLEQCCRGSDFIARIGGEEFLVLQPETGLEGAVQAAEKLRQAVSQLDIPEVGRATVSIGVATLRRNSRKPIREVLRSADEALYAAKHGGRNRVVAAPSSDTPSDDDDEDDKAGGGADASVGVGAEACAPGTVTPAVHI